MKNKNKIYNHLKNYFSYLTKYILFIFVFIYPINSQAFFASIALVTTTSAVRNAAQRRLVNVEDDNKKLIEQSRDGFIEIKKELDKAPPASLYQVIYESISGEKLKGQTRYSLNTSVLPWKSEISPDSINLNNTLNTGTSSLKHYIGNTFNFDGLTIKKDHANEIIQSLRTVIAAGMSPLSSTNYLAKKNKHQKQYIRELSQFLINRHQRSRKLRFKKYKEEMSKTVGLKESIDFNNILKLEKLSSRYEKREIRDRIALAELLNHLTKLKSKSGSIGSIGKTRFFDISP